MREKAEDLLGDFQEVVRRVASFPFLGTCPYPGLSDITDALAAQIRKPLPYGATPFGTI